jgi:shikimate kinase
MPKNGIAIKNQRSSNLRRRFFCMLTTPMQPIRFPHLNSRYIGMRAMTSAPDNSNLANRRSTSAIALVGMMGVGKTSIGRKLAEKLDLPFVDADHEIEKASGLTIAEIFERFGEDYFRDGERRVIARLIDGEAKVIATGGGAFINDETRTLMLQKATIIWLDADIDILVERVSRRQNRPLLNGKDPRETLIQLAKDRNPKYAEAHIHVRSESLPHAEMVEQLMKALSE